MYKRVTPPAYARRVVLAAVLLVIAGCSRSYQGERLLWRAQQQVRSILEPSRQAPSESQVNAALAALRAVVDKAPGTASAATACLMLGRVYATRHDSAQAQAAYQEVIRKHSQDPRAVVQALAELAAIEAAQGNRDAAIGHYREIADRFPWSMPGLAAPIQIARLSEQAGASDQARDAWQEAIRWYQEHLAVVPVPELEAPIKGFLVVAYERSGQWQASAGMLEELARSDKAGINRPKVLYDLALLYGSRLAQPQREDALLQELAKTYPEDPFGRAAAARLRQLAGDSIATPRLLSTPGNLTAP